MFCCFSEKVVAISFLAETATGVQLKGICNMLTKTRMFWTRALLQTGVQHCMTAGLCDGVLPQLVQPPHCPATPHRGSGNAPPAVVQISSYKNPRLFHISYGKALLLTYTPHHLACLLASDSAVLYVQRTTASRSMKQCMQRIDAG